MRNGGSQGTEKNVNTVTPIFVDRVNEYLIFQKWEIVEVPKIRVTRRRGLTVGVPMLRGEVEIVGTTVIGGKNDEDDKDGEDEEDEEEGDEEEEAEEADEGDEANEANEANDSVRNGAVRPSWARTRTDDISSSRPVFS